MVTVFLLLIWQALCHNREMTSTEQAAGIAPSDNSVQNGNSTEFLVIATGNPKYAECNLEHYEEYIKNNPKHTRKIWLFNFFRGID